MNGNKKAQINNLEDIKSLYIIKEVFSLIYEKQKLNIIIYNKHLQNKFEVNIEDYKKLSGKYTKVEKNGNGKVYELYTNKLIFEGEYLSGKKHGKGREYDSNGKLKFEGEYLNGKKMEKEKNFMTMMITKVGR